MFENYVTLQQIDKNSFEDSLGPTEVIMSTTRFEDDELNIFSIDNKLGSAKQIDETSRFNIMSKR